MTEVIKTVTSISTFQEMKDWGLTMQIRPMIQMRLWMKMRRIKMSSHLARMKPTKKVQSQTQCRLLRTWRRRTSKELWMKRNQSKRAEIATTIACRPSLMKMRNWTDHKLVKRETISKHKEGAAGIRSMESSHRRDRTGDIEDRHQSSFL